MLHAEYVTGNPITGRQVWIIRHINGTWGDRFDWCCNVVKPHYFSRTAIIEAMIGKGITRQQVRQLTEFVIVEMGFSQGRAIRNGRWVTYRMKRYKGTNGITRNILKLWDEFLIVCRGMKPHFNRDFTDRPLHVTMNLFVEALRLSPYFWGHVWAIWLTYKLIIWGVAWTTQH